MEKGTVRMSSVRRKKHLLVRGVDRRGERCAKGTIRIVAWGELR